MFDDCSPRARARDCPYPEAQTPPASEVVGKCRWTRPPSDHRGNPTAAARLPRPTTRAVQHGALIAAVGLQVGQRLSGNRLEDDAISKCKNTKHSRESWRRCRKMLDRMQARRKYQNKRSRESWRRCRKMLEQWKARQRCQHKLPLLSNCATASLNYYVRLPRQDVHMLARNHPPGTRPPVVWADEMLAECLRDLPRAVVHAAMTLSASTTCHSYQIVQSRLA